MPIADEEIKNKAETFGNHVYELMMQDERFKGFTYRQLIAVLDHMHTQIFFNIHQKIFHQEQIKQ